MSKYVASCRGCDISRGAAQPQGGVLHLGEYWVANHYGGAGGYLGWLALQTTRHCMDVRGLTDDEARELGIAIKTVDGLLTEYWARHFSPNDDVERVHIVYFFESVFDVPPTDYHLHLHLIPRTRKLARLLREFPDRMTNSRAVSELTPWKTPWITTSEFFPEEYLRRSERIDALMEWLRSRAARLI